MIQDCSGNTDWPPVTVNILAHDRRDEVNGTLRAVSSELDYPAEHLEVLVVDNASRDGTAEMVEREFADVAVVRREENIGVSGWNDGFRAGRGDYFLVLDDDCYVTGDALKLAVSAAREEDADLVSFRVISSWHRQFEFSEAYRTGLLSFWGCAALISRRAIERLDGFDPQIFVSVHELDFTARLLDAGMRHLYLPEVEAIHLKRPDPPDPRSHAVHLANLAYFAAKSLRPRDAAGAIANLGTRVVISAVRNPAHARVTLGAAITGIWRGVRRRAPLRAEVSRLYRRDFQDFTSLLGIVRGVGERRSPSGPTPEPRSADAYSSRALAFFVRRPQLYPRARAALRIELPPAPTGAP